MSEDSINNTVKKWMIISWKHQDHLDAAYGKLLGTVDGTYDEAVRAARTYVDHYRPVGVCGVIE